MAIATTQDIHQQQAEIVELDARIERLLRRDIQLGSELAEISDQVRHGNASRAPEVARILAEKSQGGNELRILQQRLNTARVQLSQHAEAQRKQQLAQILAAMQNARERVIEGTRAAALALGELRTLDKQAVELLNCANMLGTGGAFPHEAQQVMALAALPDPYIEWTNDKVFLPVEVGGRFNFTILVRPVTPR